MKDTEKIISRMKIVFSERLNKQMELNRVAPSCLAKLIGTTASTMMNYRQGITMPSLPLLVKLSAALEVTPDYLIGWSDVTKPEYDEAHLELGLSGNAQQSLRNLATRGDIHTLDVINSLIEEPLNLDFLEATAQHY